MLFAGGLHKVEKGLPGKGSPDCLILSGILEFAVQ
jgi:hypothetical protein